jgi:TRAP-type C4-dicarboxylate transport system substrate-binding protein
MTHGDPARSIGWVVSRTVALVIVAGLLAGCGSGAVDKAGGSRTPVVLRLADSNNSDQPDTGALEYFAAQVAKRSAGALRIRITYMAAGSATPYVEERTITAVRGGRFDLGWIGARAWDEVGVTSFRALQAPFLITGKRLLDRVVSSPLANEMLDSLEKQDVVGVALVPDYLRHPAGMGRPLVSPADFHGARVRIQPSRVSAALIKALGAAPAEISNSEIGYAIGQKQIDGQEVAMLSNPGGSVLAGNVVFFAKAMTLFANHDSYDRLTEEQQRILRGAAAATVRHAVLRYPTDAEIAQHFCFDRRRIVFATASDLATLRREAQPVYRMLEADAETKRLIRQIEAWKRTTPVDPAMTVSAQCRRIQRPVGTAGPLRAASVLDGTYRWVLTRSDAHRRFGPHLNPGDTYPMVGTAILRRGTWRLVGADGDRGSFTIRGSRIRFVWPRVASVLVFTFVRDDDGTIHLKPVLPMDRGDQFVWAYKPWRRIGPPTQTAR